VNVDDDTVARDHGRDRTRSAKPVANAANGREDADLARPKVHGGGA
jgi:hypothetical protein